MSSCHLRWKDQAVAAQANAKTQITIARCRPKKILIIVLITFSKDRHQQAIDDAPTSQSTAISVQTLAQVIQGKKIKFREKKIQK